MKKQNQAHNSTKWNTLLGSSALVAAGFAMFAANPALAQVASDALPTGESVANGSATFDRSTENNLTVNQGSDRVVIDWATFDVGENATTEFVQPGSNSLAVNRIHDADASQILGTLKANGQVMLLNSNGVFFGANARIDVGGIVASTGALTNAADVMAGADPVLSNFGDASVVNNASITVADAGLAAFVAPSVVNNGVITAKTGRIGFAGASGDSAVTVDLYGDGLFEMTAGTESGSVSVDHQGAVYAEGGSVVMTAATAKNIVDGVINTDGIVDVQSVSMEGGKIVLSAGDNGDVTATGTMDASGTEGGFVDVYGQNIDVNAEIHADGGKGTDGNGNGGDVYVIGENAATVRGTITAKGGTNGGDGGFVETSGYETLAVSDLSVSTTASNGTYGSWLLDPTNITIYQTGASGIDGVSGVDVATLDSAESNISLLADNDITFSTDVNIAKEGISLTATSGNTINLHNNSIRTNNGDVTFVAGGAISINSGTIFTRGGDVSLTGNTVSINNNAAIGTSGGDVFITGTTTDLTKTAVNINRSFINTTGGSSENPDIILTVNGTEYNKTTGWSAYKGTFETGTYGGTITISGVSFAGHPNSCFSAGGANCLVEDPISLIELIVTIMDWEKIYGEDDPLFTWALTTGTLNDGDTLTVDLARDTGEDVGSYSIYQSSYTLSNEGDYSISFVNGSFTITPKDLTVTAVSDSKTYDGLAYTGGNGVTYSGFAFDDDAADLDGTLTYGGTSQGAVNAGDYTITAGGLTSGNYNITYDPGTLTIDKALVTVTADNQTMTYGNAMPTLTASYSGFVEGEGTDDLTSEATVESGTAASSDVGAYYDTLAASGAAAQNYSFDYVEGDLTINQATLTATANDDSKTYDGLAYTGGNGVAYSGFVNGDNEGSITITGDVTYGGDSQGAVDANTYTIEADGTLTTKNYNIVYGDGLLTIDPKALTLAVNDASKTYGDLNNPEFTGTLSGVIAGDDITVDYDTDATQFSNAGGTYTINGALTGTDLGNYTLAAADYTAGTLTIKKAALTLTADSFSKTYGETVTFDGDEYTITAGTLYTENGDSITGTTITSDGAAATADVDGSPYTVNITGATGTNLDNYNIDYQAGALTIGQATLTLVVDDKSKTYGDENPTLTGTLTGGVEGDDLNVTYSTLAEQYSNVGTYAIEGALTGTDADNYTLVAGENYTPGTLTIDPKALTLAVNDASKTYGDLNPELTGTLSGVIAGDDITVDYDTDATQFSNAGGTYTIDGALTGGDLGNYTLAAADYTAGTLTINKAALTVTANDAEMTYGGDMPDLTASYSGFVGDEGTDNLATLATVTSGTDADADAGTYTDTLTASGAAAQNYSFEYVKGDLKINQAALTLTANSQTKTYGDTDPALTYELDGLTNGDEAGDVLAGALSREAGEDVNDYDILQGTLGLGSDNYTLSYTGNSFEITPATLTVTADPQTKVEGTADPALTYTVSGLKFDDTADALLWGDLTREPGETVGNYQIMQGTLGLAFTGDTFYGIEGLALDGGDFAFAPPNYTLAYVGNVLTITAAAVQKTADVDQEDIFLPVERTNEITGNMAVSVTGLPVIPGSGTAATGTTAFELAAIAPAAGGDEQTSAEDVATIEPAAGGGTVVGCWDDTIFGAERGGFTTYSFDYAPDALLADTANCGTVSRDE